MYNSPSSTILEYSLEVVALCRPIVEAVQRKDRDLGSQLRRAISSITLNLAEGFGCTQGHARIRFETALGSSNEAQAGVQLALAWGYVSNAAVADAAAALARLGARIAGLVRR
jgi:four helix bundle protein